MSVHWLPYNRSSRGSDGIEPRTSCCTSPKSNSRSWSGTDLPPSPLNYLQLAGLRAVAEHAQNYIAFPFATWCDGESAWCLKMDGTGWHWGRAITKPGVCDAACTPNTTSSSPTAWSMDLRGAVLLIGIVIIPVWDFKHLYDWLY